MKFAIFILLLISIVTANPIDLTKVDAYAAAHGNKFESAKYELNVEYRQKADQLEVNNPFLNKMLTAIVKCNIFSAVQLIGKTSLDASHQTKLRELQNEYNSDITKLKSQFKFAACKR